VDFNLSFLYPRVLEVMKVVVFAMITTLRVDVIRMIAANKSFIERT